MLHWGEKMLDSKSDPESVCKRPNKTRGLNGLKPFRSCKSWLVLNQRSECHCGKKPAKIGESARKTVRTGESGQTVMPVLF
jgi:hypothetical protein